MLGQGPGTAPPALAPAWTQLCSPEDPCPDHTDTTRYRCHRCSTAVPPSRCWMLSCVWVPTAHPGARGWQREVGQLQIPAHGDGMGAGICPQRSTAVGRGSAPCALLPWLKLPWQLCRAHFSSTSVRSPAQLALGFLWCPQVLPLCRWCSEGWGHSSVAAALLPALRPSRQQGSHYQHQRFLPTVTCWGRRNWGGGGLCGC